MRFLHTAKFAVSPSNLKNLTASPGAGRARKPSGYFFGTFFVQAKKVRQCAAAILADEQAENNKFNLPQKQARFRAINSSTKTQTANQNSL